MLRGVSARAQKGGAVAINSALSPAKLDRSTIYLCGERLWEQIEKHLSERTLLSRASEIRNILAKSPNPAGTTLFMSHDRAEVRVAPPASASPADNVIRAIFRFPLEGETVTRRVDQMTCSVTPDGASRLLQESDRPFSLTIVREEEADCVWNDGAAWNGDSGC